MTRKVAFSAAKKKQQLQSKRAKKQNKDSKWDWQDSKTVQKGEAKMKDPEQDANSSEEEQQQVSKKSMEVISMVTDENSKFVTTFNENMLDCEPFLKRNPNKW